MIPAHLVPLANHLWQSTIVAAVAALLVVALRHNTARVRYWIWFAAGIKFLVAYTPTPFSAAKLARDGRELPGVDPNGPSLLNAVEEQLGFKLQTKKMPIPVVVIDHIEPPTEN